MDIAEITARITLAIMDNVENNPSLREDFSLDDNEIIKLSAKWATEYVSSKTTQTGFSVEDFVAVEFYELANNEGNKDLNTYRAVIGDIMAHYGGDWHWDDEGNLKITHIDMPEYTGNIYAETGWVTKLYEFWKDHHTEL